MKRPRQNVNKTRLPKELMAFLYGQVILRWEKDLALHTGFNIQRKEFQTFRRKHGITLDPQKNIEDFTNRMKSALPSGSWFVFCDRESAQSKSLFKHIRNAAAHGHIRKTGSKISLHSYSQKKEVMRGEIEIKIFEAFILALVDTATSKEEST